MGDGPQMGVPQDRPGCPGTHTPSPASAPPIGALHPLIACNTCRVDAYAGLLGLIRTGELDAGVKVSELSLAERLGVSRTPVREALRVLDAQGLVDSRGRGVRVRVPQEQDLTEALQTRCALEGFAVQCAARAQREGLLLPAHLHEVERLAIVCDDATRSGGATAGADANRVFHLALAALAGNRQIDSLLELIWDQITIATRAGLTDPPRVDAVHHEHDEILSALRAGDPTRARTAIEVHIEQTEQTTRLNSGQATPHQAAPPQTKEHV